MSELWQDLRFAARMGARNPVFTCIAILVLALGIGATIAIFTVVNAVLLRPLPYPDPGRLVAVATLTHNGNGTRLGQTVSLNQVEQWRAADASLASIGSWVLGGFPAMVHGQAMRLIAAGVDPELLPTLGVAPERGHNFAGTGSTQEDLSVIVSHQLWRSAMHGAPDALGQTIRLENQDYTVIGVLPGAFEFPRQEASYFDTPPDLLLPIADIADAWGRNTTQWFAIARLKPGVTLAAAQAANVQEASSGYLAAVGIPLLRGRDIAAADLRASEPVALVNQALVARYLAGRDPIGRKLLDPEGGRPRTIVGVVADAHDRGLAVPSFPTIYLPLDQGYFGYGAIVLRTTQPPDVVFPELRRRIAELDPDVALSGLTTIAARLRKTLDQPIFYATMAGVCALMAALFVGLGLYGVISFSVARRTREIGVRIALGAMPAQIVSGVLAQGLAMSLAGLAAGLLLALLLTRSLASLLFGVRANDPAAFAGAAVFVLAVALAASLLPALRASHIDPAVTLKAE